jgi:hypothetical protein
LLFYAWRGSSGENRIRDHKEPHAYEKQTRHLKVSCLFFVHLYPSTPIFLEYPPNVDRLQYH